MPPSFEVVRHAVRDNWNTQLFSSPLGGNRHHQFHISLLKYFKNKWLHTLRVVLRFGFFHFTPSLEDSSTTHVELFYSFLIDA